MSWIGIAVSIVWIIPAVAVLVTLGPRNAKANDPGCVGVESSRRPLYRKMIADAGDDEAFKADLQTMIADLHDGAGKTHSDSARAAMNAMASDYQQVLNALSGDGTGTDALARFDSDATAVDVACSHS